MSNQNEATCAELERTGWKKRLHRAHLSPATRYNLGLMLISLYSISEILMDYVVLVNIRILLV